VSGPGVSGINPNRQSIGASGTRLIASRRLFLPSNFHLNTQPEFIPGNSHIREILCCFRPREILEPAGIRQIEDFSFLLARDCFHVSAGMRNAKQKAGRDDRHENFDASFQRSKLRSNTRLASSNSGCHKTSGVLFFRQSRILVSVFRAMCGHRLQAHVMPGTGW
jgi:hypothetical protein